MNLIKYYNVFILIVFMVVSCFSCLKTETNTYKDKVFTDVLRCDSGWIAGDGAFSIPLSDNRSLWAFGDSYIDCFDPETGTVPCLFQARNAVMLMDNNPPYNCITLKNISGSSSFFEYGTDRKYWFWPEHGYFYNDTIYIFLSRIRSTGVPGMWGFERVDSNYIAKICISESEKTLYSILPSKNNIDFGLSVVMNNDGYNYIYGIRSNGFGNDLFVARFKPGNVYGNWEYFTGRGWSLKIDNIKKIHDEFTASFSIVKIKDRFLLFTTEFSVDCDQGKNIYLYSSGKPEGPFKNRQSIWQVDDTLNGHWPMFYAVSAHPEYENGKDELLVTYCINGYGKCVETCINGRMNPDVYRPRAIRVPFYSFRK